MKRILFIGNSHTYFNDMPHMVQELNRAAGAEPMEVTMLTQGGMTLDWHSHQEQTRFNILYGNYDYVVLQQAAHPFDGKEVLRAGVCRLLEYIRNTPAKTVLYMTWSQKAEPERQSEMTVAYQETAQECGTMLAPVGSVWSRIRERHPEIELYYTDGAHASGYGSYLAACVIWRTLTGGRLPADNSLYDAWRLERALCQVIQQEVQDAVSGL